ncbi:hypothetical protein M422DRAFT_253506 [Sphaerobolus stellatus SS14]|uniref:Uncharacterized protein n=1 Tax=Sphaerobolus stellatus (strain SS14) TaxID=990650 RepID=A0A0C9V8J5_SPHS4|nr:hypothetical protein M422DRAFT_253506 [Sphaerobolus stellatus SS14]
MASFFRHPTIKAVATIVSLQTEHASGEHPVSENAIDLLKQTIYFNTDHPGPALFMFTETTGFRGVYTSAVETIDTKIIAFEDEGWGNTENHSNDTIESIGKNLVQKIFQIQLTGPFYLAGWTTEGVGPQHSAPFNVQYEHIQQSSRSTSMEAWPGAFINYYPVERPIGWQKYSGNVVLVKALKGKQDQDGIATPSNDSANGWRPFLPQLVIHGFD